MAVVRHIVQSCCGSKAIIFEIAKPITKTHIPAFESAGYSVPSHFLRAGIFYVQKQGLIATSSFGTNRINVRCGGTNCETLLRELEQLFETVTV